ncbi:glycogen debranching protein GlgX [Haemophilus parainfluenzae]|uniref:glycogen debranching protein GlgX n=1 Tax=Haemophilus parainfluenzae TaxID=729 RepID=UPI000FFF08EA|nr:glycogen debranching protein GlgX [Haemophilus parainfluenzae]KAB1991688.1 glycogen debranching protein GlgX [Haemophilus parainfluenzae]QAT95247.1 glycogen debranching protein GlgX [Haemophilus parainfluenzae]
MFSIYNNGKPSPMGYSQTLENGLKISNFALFSSTAGAIELCLFRDGKESLFAMSRTDDIWHVAIEGVELNDEYAFRITGKNDRTLANPQKLMLDPYAKAVTHKPDLSSPEARSIFLLNDERDNAAGAPKGRIVDENFDWSGDCKPFIPWAKTIVYELNVKGFSQLNSRIPENIRGTYAALAHPENIAYFKSLGITSLELLPVNFFIDEPHLQEKGLRNYWGYNPLAMFALEPSYAADQKQPLNEFKSMIKTLHQAGIEVILDVVFNHTAESEKTFPTFCQRGIDDKTYYWQNEQGDYTNWTGCGNMLNLANDVTSKWVLDCLRYWVTECHVDGFRFDLATVLGRETPDFNPNAKLFAEMEQDDVLQKIKLIAEPWDIGHYGYQVGYFPAYFSQWNDRFRDDMCRFWLWQSGEVGAFAERFAGSSDIFNREGRLPHGSLNFITAHDGFTLRDLVSYNHKHNKANGEENRDGRNENYSYNHGIEDSQLDLADEWQSAVEKRRVLSEKGLLGSLLLANGVPMLLAGDEFGNSQYGNNNAYCQDNEITWLKWDDFNQTLFDFTKQTIALRKKIKSLQQEAWWSDENVVWLNTGGNPMTLDDWHNRESKALQIMLDGKYLFLINAKTEPQSFYFPSGKWKKIAETENSVIQQCDVSGIAFEVLEHMDDENDGVCYEK